MNTRKYIYLLGLLLALLSPVPASADITFYVRPDGDKGFIIEGDDIKATESVEITVVYDTTILANPRVKLLQAGNVTNIDDSNPGTLVFNANQGDEPGPSFEAHLSFEKMKDIQGGIFSVNGKIMGQDGTISPSRTMPDAPVSQSSSLLTVATNFGEMVSSSEQSEAPEEAAASGNRLDMLMKAEKSVLQRFREFKGGRNLRAFAALFARNPGGVLSQEPPVVLSDGKSPVNIRLALHEQGNGAPNFAMSDAKLVRLRKDDENGWVVTALPNEGTWNARLIVETDGKRIEFPLAVAPALSIHKNVTEENFDAQLDSFVAELIAGGKGENDPLRRALYEYCFTANYLAGRENQPAEKMSEQARVKTNTN